LAIACGDTVNVWETTGRHVRTLAHLSAPLAIAFIPTEPLLAVVAGDLLNPTRLQVWSLYSGQLVHELQRRSIVSITVSPDGRTIAIGITTSPLPRGPVTLELLDLRPRGLTLRAALPLGDVSGLQAAGPTFSSDGRVVVVGGRLWDAALGLPIGPPLGDGGQQWMASFSSDDRQLFLLPATADDTEPTSSDLVRWNVDPLSWVATARAIANRELTSDERTQFIRAT
jgi:hypothetical protein